MQKLFVTLVVVAGLFPAPVVCSQTLATPDDASGSVFSDFARDLKRLPSKETALTLGLAGALAIAMHPVDRALTERAARSTPLDRVFEVGEITGDGWAQGGAALATFVVGHAIQSARVQAVGTDLVQAQLLAGIMTHGLKVAAHRTRPDGGRFSFPSGHASSTFATATVLQRHFGWKAGMPAYGLAAYVAVSRLQERRHYPSDVIIGAALGSVSGRTMTVGRGHGRFALAPIAVPGGAGIVVARIP